MDAASPADTPSQSRADDAMLEVVRGDGTGLDEYEAALPMEAILCFFPWKELVGKHCLLSKEILDIIRRMTPSEKVLIHSRPNNTCRALEGLLRSFPKAECLEVRVRRPLYHEYRMPIEFLQPVSSFVHLKCLELVDLGLRRLPSLSGMSSLEELNISENLELEWSLEMLSGLTELKVLKCIESVSIEGDLNNLQNLDKLTRLDLTDCRRVTGSLSAFKNVRMLTYLDLLMCLGVTGSLFDLRELRMLSYLNLFSCTDVTGSLLCLRDLRNTLTHLYLSRCRGVTGRLSDLRGFGVLEVLWLSDCDVTGSLSDLRGLHMLADLNLDRTNVTGSLWDLRELRSTLDCLYLVGCSGVGGSVLGLRDFTNLSWAELRETSVATADGHEIGPGDFPALTREGSERLLSSLTT